MSDDWTLKYHRAVKASEKKRFNWRARAFDKQQSFIEDKHRLKAAFTTRRGAKSYADGIYLLKEAHEYDKCNCLYLGLTRLSAKGIIWKDILKDINDKDDLGVNFHETELTATTQNGSTIYVAGVDVDENERKKLFGRKYRLVIIDEAALYSINLRDLVYVTLRPAMTDTQGTIVLSGMASNATHGLFYDITTKKEEGWSLHEWTAYDNPFVAKQWAEELEFIKQHQPLLMKTPGFRQAYLNEWVVDDDAKVFKFNKERNSAERMPVLDIPYHYILGIDLGHSPDPSAFVVGCYNDISPLLYIVHAEKHLCMDISSVADKVRELNTRFNFDVKVVDNANKQAVAELNNRHGLNLIPADKTGKADFINIMNADFIQQKIFLLPNASELASEYESLIWIMEDGKVKEPRKEHPGMPNHHTDAALYLYRYCYSYLFSEPAKKPVWGSQSDWEPKHLRKMEEDVRQKQNPNSLDLVGVFDDDLFEFDQDEMI